MFAPNELFEITYRIRANGSSSGTCFTLENEGRKYLITAKHVLTGKNSSIEVETSSGFQPILFSSYYEPSNPEIDIAAILLDQSSENFFIFNSAFFNVTSTGLPLGMDTYFLGYPYNLANQSISTSTRSHPIVKKGISSGLAYDPSHSPIGFLLDGHNNPGFSGGPCFFFNNLSGEPRWQLFGVVSSYISQTETLKDEKGRPIITINENSGIINTHSIDKIISELPKK